MELDSSNLNHIVTAWIWLRGNSEYLKSNNSLARSSPKGCNIHTCCWSTQHKISSHMLYFIPTGSYWWVMEFVNSLLTSTTPLHEARSTHTWHGAVDPSYLNPHCYHCLNLMIHFCKSQHQCQGKASSSPKGCNKQGVKLGDGNFWVRVNIKNPHHEAPVQKPWETGCDVISSESWSLPLMGDCRIASQSC